MLNFSRVNRAKLVLEPINFKSLIDDCLSDLEYLPNYNNIYVETKIETGGNIFASDPLRVQIIFGNIISNAFKYMNPLADRNILDIKISIDKKCTSISFKDNGIGIKEEYLKKIYDMFFRANFSSEGSGLGLYIVKQSIEKLNGNIEIKSLPGISTEVNIRLPNQLSELKNIAEIQEEATPEST